MKTAEEMNMSSAAEIAEDLKKLIAAMDQGGLAGHWKEGPLTVEARIDELARRASSPAPQAKEKKSKKTEIVVNTALKPDRMNLAMTADVKAQYQDFLKDKKSPYVYTSAALTLFMEQYSDRTIRVLLEA